MSYKKYSKLEYQKYLKSDYWFSIRERFKNHKYIAYECSVCKGEESLNIHHKHYNRMGRERMLMDIIVLCGACHMDIHKASKSLNKMSLKDALEIVRRDFKRKKRGTYEFYQSGKVIPNGLIIPM